MTHDTKTEPPPGLSAEDYPVVLRQAIAEGVTLTPVFVDLERGVCYADFADDVHALRVLACVAVAFPAPGDTVDVRPTRTMPDYLRADLVSAGLAEKLGVSPPPGMGRPDVELVDRMSRALRDGDRLPSDRMAEVCHLLDRLRTLLATGGDD